MLGILRSVRASRGRKPLARKLARTIRPTDRERFFDEDDIIVSKTDTKGRLTYVNRIFMAISDYEEAELLGKPHSIIRHPDMPRAIYRLMWEHLQAGREIFAYVKNMASDGGYYWTLAHVTPSFGPGGEISGYHSNRRVPDRPSSRRRSPRSIARCARPRTVSTTAAPGSRNRPRNSTRR